MDRDPPPLVEAFVAATLAAIILRIFSLLLEAAAVNLALSISSVDPRYLFIVLIGALAYLAAYRASLLARWSLLAFCLLALFASTPELFWRVSITDVNPVVKARFENLMRWADITVFSADIVLTLGTCMLLFKARPAGSST